MCRAIKELFTKFFREIHRAVPQSVGSDDERSDTTWITAGKVSALADKYYEDAKKHQ